MKHLCVTTIEKKAVEDCYGPSMLMCPDCQEVTVDLNYAAVSENKNDSSNLKTQAMMNQRRFGLGGGDE